MARNFEVIKSNYDASRPYAVIATFRSFNKVVGRYSTKKEALTNARYKNSLCLIRK